MIANNQFITNHYGTDGLLKIVDIDYNIVDNINYAVNFEEFLYYTIPTIFRIYEKEGVEKRDVLYYYLLSIIRVFQQKANLTTNTRNAILQRMIWNSQTLRLQQMLRDVFQNDNIYVNNASYSAYNNYLFNRDESPAATEQVYLHNRDEVVLHENQLYLFNIREKKEYDILITLDINLKTQNDLIINFLKIYTLTNKIIKIEYVSF